jgi:hypothetical protein
MLLLSILVPACATFFKSQHVIVILELFDVIKQSTLILQQNRSQLHFTEDKQNTVVTVLYIYFLRLIFQKQTVTSIKVK